jgi:hypothetical protein
MKLSLPKTTMLACGLVLSVTCFAEAQELPPLGTPAPVQDSAITIPPPVEMSDQALPAPNMQEGLKDEYKKDWRQAGPDGLGNRLRSHIVRLNENDRLVGRVTVIESVTGDLQPVGAVTIRFIRKGEVIEEVTPDSRGDFTARKLTEGVYSMIAAGSDGFLAWSVNVKPKLSDVAKMPKHLRAKYLTQDVSDRLDVEAAAVPPSNFAPLKRLLLGYLPSEGSMLSLAGSDVPPGMEDPPADARTGTTLKHHQVRLTKDGRLIGRIRKLQPDTGRDLKIIQLNAFLLRNNEQVDQEQVNPDGTFAFKDLRPGVYSMVAAGKDGFLAFSIDVLNPPQTEATVPRRGAKIKTAAFRVDDAQIALSLEMALCSPEDLNATNLARHTGDFTNNTTEAVAAAQPTGGGFSPGGGFAGTPGTGGFGGGVGGGGVPPSAGTGLGQILATAAVGVGVRSLVDDDDNGISSPASPGSGTQAGSTTDETEETEQPGTEGP